MKAIPDCGVFAGKAERDFGQGYHVMSKGEADHLVNLLNRVAA